MEYSSLTFANDKLSRETFVKNLTKVIDGWDNYKHENDSLVMSIDAPWGSGKSFLLNMWKNWLVSEENKTKKYTVTYYNAWENDDSDNAFIPLVFSLQQLDVGDEELKNQLSENFRSFLKGCAISLLKDGIKKVIGDETAKCICDGIDTSIEDKTTSFYDNYNTYMQQKDHFRNALTNLIPENGKLIVFVDELDRCRPNFAIETLEIVKHFFNIKDIVFIFGIDLDQLSHSISTLYGNGMDSSGYLRRFIDVNVNIPSGDINCYLTTILTDKFDTMPYLIDFVDIAVNLFVKLKLSLRDIDKITNNFIVFCFFYNDNIEDTSAGLDVILETYLYFMILKYKYPTIYDLIIRNDFIAYNNQPKNWDVLDLKYFVSPTINRMLNDLQTGRAHDSNVGPDLILSYCFDGYITENKTFAEHIEKTLEMFNA